MRATLLWTSLAAGISVGCVDAKDTGEDSDGSGGSDDPVRSIDAGACPEGGLDGSGRLPLTTALVESGVFQMGNNDDPDSAPAHEVTLEAGVQMSITEITQGQWTDLGFANPSQHNTCTQCPVEQVTWHEAAAFAEALSAQDGLGSCYTCSGAGADTECIAPDNPYECSGWRLPTEAEWEAAASADDTAWAGSDDFAMVAWTVEAVGQPCPVGTLQPTADGFYDLSGNVSEWVHDGYAAYSGDDATNPVGTESATRVVRGGSMFQVAGEAVVTAREGKDMQDYVPWRGFRLVKPAE
ncbi:MAG: hypothetical protein CL927_06630 [Deltaproteobacteria bacterium]|nr:hypothetical protein [Deltaproteobacteria bacterium]HCH66466.1 hypothetical protein [Deltaproteobacteria bacterium]